MAALPRSLASHVAGSRLLISRKHPKAAIEAFYHRVFPFSGAAATTASPPNAVAATPVDFARSIFSADSDHEEELVASNGGAMWLPEIAMPRSWIDAFLCNPAAQGGPAPAAVVCSRTPDGDTVIARTVGGEAFMDKSQLAASAIAQETLHVIANQCFVVRSCESLAAATRPAGVRLPPFDAIPAEPGHTIWMDWCVQQGAERHTAKTMRRLFTHNIARPIDIPKAGLYITVLNNTRLKANRDKLAGIVPMRLLLPDEAVPKSVPLMFFGCPTAKDLEARVEVVTAAGGKKVLGPLTADGTVCIVRDPLGAHFALYHRTDAWDEVKPSTNIDNDVDRSVAYSPAKA